MRASYCSDSSTTVLPSLSDLLHDVAVPNSANVASSSRAARRPRVGDAVMVWFSPR